MEEIKKAAGADGISAAEDVIITRNRDLRALADLVPIMQEVRQIERAREWQRDRMFNITQVLSGMPRGGGLPKGIDDAMALLSGMEEELEEKCRAYVHQMRICQRILNGIDSHSMRAFVILKYILDAPDTEIRQELNLTRRGFERARRCVEEAECMAEVKWRESVIVRSEE